MKKIIYSDIEKLKIDYYNAIVKVNKDKDSKTVCRKEIKAIDRILDQIPTDKKITLKRILCGSFSELVEMSYCIERHIQFKTKLDVLNEYKEYGESVREFIKKYFATRKSKARKIILVEDKSLGNTIKKNIDKRICNILGFENVLYENDTIRNKISNFFIANSKGLNIKSCFYCNIDYVNTFETATSRKAHFTLDHLLPKVVHPYFSISLFNLIPSCYSCNSKFKHVNEFTINDNLIKKSPSSEVYNLNEKLKFKIFFDIKNNSLLNRLGYSDYFKICIVNTENDEHVDEFVKIFQLKGRYEFHKGIAEDMIDKRRRYSDSQLLELSNLTGVDVETIKKDIFGKEAFEESNAPFEKYKGDIAEELSLK